MSVNLLKDIRKNYYIFIIIFISALFLIPYLGKYYIQPTTDLWIKRAVHFYYAIKSYNFPDSYTMYHPGVTIMWLVGITSGIFYKITGGVDIFSYDVFPKYIFFSTLSVVLAEIAALLFLYKVLLRILGKKTAFLSCLVLLFEPFFLGNARSIHMDTLVSLFTILSLSYFYLGLKEFKKNDFVASGLFLGFGILTRINSGIVFAFYIIWTFFLLTKRKIDLKSAFKLLLIVGVTTLVIFYLFFPAMWQHPYETLSKIVSEGVFDTALAEQSRRGVFLGLARFPLLQKVIAYPLYLFFRLTPTIIVALVFFVISTRKLLELSVKKYTRFLLAFAFFYYLFITIPDKQIFRYVLPILPTLAVIAGIALNQAKGKVQVLYYLVQLFFLIPIFPNFFVFFNPLLGGIKTASNVINLNQDATGYYEIAKYLNLKPNVESITLAMYDSNSFQPLFKGNALMLKTFEGTYGKKVDTDYVLLPLSMGLEFLPKDRYNLETTFRISGVDYYYLFARNK